MKSTLIALVLLGVVACELAAARSHSDSLAWRHFKKQHGKVYASQEEDARRFANFLATKQRVERHNADASATFTMELNHMADWTADEKSRLNGFRLPEGPRRVISDAKLMEIIGEDAPVPDEVDWRKVAGRVSAVKDQGNCGSDWAFAAIGVIEGQELPHNISSFAPLSEQQLLDCSWSNQGCKGGYVNSAINDLVDPIEGVETEQDYPYVGKVQLKCSKEKSKFLPLDLRGSEILEDEKVMKKVVANYGPVSVALYASDEFMNYKSGVFDDYLPHCELYVPNRALLAVGYGTDRAFGPYWILKNSIGNKWGEEGYVRVKAGKNMCGIGTWPTIATFNH